MKTETYYSWEYDDPYLLFVNSAINLLAAFKDESCDGLGEKAFSRVVVNKHFTKQDMAHLKDYLQRLAERAQNKYEGGKLADAPWRDAIMAAVANAHDACTRLDEMLEASLNPTAR